MCWRVSWRTVYRRVSLRAHSCFALNISIQDQIPPEKIPHWWWRVLQRSLRSLWLVVAWFEFFRGNIYLCPQFGITLSRHFWALKERLFTQGMAWMECYACNIIIHWNPLFRGGKCERMMLNCRSNKKNPWLDFTFKFLEKRQVKRNKI